MSAAPQILLVDDEPMLANGLARMLRRHGFEAEVAVNGKEALERLAARDFDLVLCDVRMPVLDGPGMLRGLREEGRAAPPVVMLTGYGDLADHDLLSAGACEVCGKPIEFAQLLGVIGRWIRPSG